MAPFYISIIDSQPIRHQILATGVNNSLYSSDWNKTAIKHLINSTWHRYVKVDNSYTWRVTIGLAKTDTILYREVFVGHFMTCVMSAYANLLRYTAPLRVMEVDDKTGKLQKKRYQFDDFKLPVYDVSGKNKVAGTVFSITGDFPEHMTGMTSGKTPPQDHVLQASISKHFPPKVIEESEAFCCSMDRPQTVGSYAQMYATNPSLPVLDHKRRDFDLTTTEGVLAFLDDPATEFAQSTIGFIVNYTTEGTEAGAITKMELPVPRFSSEEVFDAVSFMETTQGGSGDAGLEPVGGHTGIKKEVTGTVKQLLVDLLIHIRDRFARLHNRRMGLQTLEDYVAEITSIFTDPTTYDGKIFSWTKLFGKQEVIKAIKLTRLIWCVGAFAFVLCKLIYTPTQKYHKVKYAFTFAAS